ncbi:hypothetical protein Mycch_5532 (plasmid) [Mycolicibacterium chubuense NBB4]|uniref:Uncharacterized protein n=1 Tax=Mycolicibacterium chubuense (strain NBB4) TaxID=710421 RepID=I4BSE0_MYCCN|nr:hypothetical protein [Mycolicibacterium chubuense]AFM20197.1 hypothetical protein Mycch_5532 [Mycolicibacterium chubuense NBB4]
MTHALTTWHRAKRDFSTASRDLYASIATATGESGPTPSPSASACDLHNDEWLESIGAVDAYSNAFTSKGVVRELEEWFAARDALANAPWNLKERLRRRMAARWSFTVIWGPTLRNLFVRPQSWRPSTVLALAAVMGVDLVEGSPRMARWRGVVDERLS